MSKIDLRKLKELKDQGRDMKELAQIFGVSLTAVYRAVKKTVRLTVPASVERLTGKQRKFIELKSTGISGTAAALEAYDCEDRKSAKEVASQLLAKPEIQAAMSDWLEFHGCGRDRRAQRLTEFVEHENAMIALQALREACKMASDYPPQNLNINVNATSLIVEQLRAAREREERLSELIYKQLESQSADSDIIDIAPDITRIEQGQMK